ncbi:MAG: hypothetical protein ACK4MD_07395 [Demequina sp.]
MTPAQEPRAASQGELEGRWAKARQFADVCDLIEHDASVDGDLVDAYVTLAVHSGIASADVICISALGAYWANGNHDQAVTLLARADAKAANHLRRLLALKTKAGYSHRPASAADVKTAAAAHQTLLEIARAQR